MRCTLERAVGRPAGIRIASELVGSRIHQGGHNMRTVVGICGNIAVTLLLGLSSVSAQQFPARPIHFISPAAAGGGFDFVVRTISPKVSEALGQPIVIENRGGAGGNVGTALAAKAAPDGYTVVLAYIGTLAIAPWMYSDLGYHPLRNFAHITQLTSVPLLAVVHPSVPAKTLKDLAAFAKAHAGQLTFGSAGASSQMTGELFKIMTGTNIVHVPYKGASPAAIDLMGGHIGLAFMSPAATTEHVRNGRLRGLAVTGTTRLAALPDVPTSTEAGYPQLVVKDWYGVSAPANTPREIISRLNAEFVRALKMPEIKDRLAVMGYETVGGSPEEFTAYVTSEYERWGEIVKKSGVKAE